MTAGPLSSYNHLNHQFNRVEYPIGSNCKLDPFNSLGIDADIRIAWPIDLLNNHSQLVNKNTYAYLLHCNDTAFESGAMQVFDTAISFFEIRHRDKCKPAGLSGTGIDNQATLQHLHIKIKHLQVWKHDKLAQ